MGKWTLDGLAGTWSDLDGAEGFGHNVIVTLRLRYDPTPLGRFHETPRLEWKEQIFTIDHQAGQWWEFAADMYAHNPTSRTLEVWTARYVAAYDFTRGESFSAGWRRGTVELRTLDDIPVARERLADTDDDVEKADAVREYLQANGGRLHIAIHDVPAIRIPPGAPGNAHRERLLTFDCGIAGGGLRFRGTQYLDVNGQNNVRRWEGSGGDSTRLLQQHAAGAVKTAPPAIVSAVRPAVLSPGWCL